MTIPLVSINIATYNSARTLKKCLDSVKDQTYGNIEIILMDSYSKDKTLAIAKPYGAKIVFASTLAKARQAGADASSGDYIFLLDSDQIMDNNVIETCVKAAEEDGLGGVTLFERSLITRDTFVERVIAYDKDIFHSLHDDDPIYGTAIPRFFRASFYKRIDFLKNPPITFEHSMVHNEIVKLGAKIKFIDAYIYHHETTTTAEVFRKFRRYGFYYMPALRSHRRLVLGHSLPRRTYFHLRAFRYPFLLFGLFYLYFLKGIAAFTGIFTYLLNDNYYGDKDGKNRKNRS